MRTFAIATLGCKVNAYESEGYIQALKSKGYKEVSIKEVADVYIINTCSVTNTAAAKSRQKMNHAKKLNKDALICLVGCFVQTSVDKDALGADILIGSSRKHQLADLIEEAFRSDITINAVETYDEIKLFENVDVTSFERKTRAFLKIQDGCNQFCSYCIIPFARGKERSLPYEEVIHKAKQLVLSNHKEIVLTGIHTGRYGHDVGSNLVSLLKGLIKIEGLERIRISSIEMNEINDELIELLKKEDKLAKNLHIPLQSGSDRILKMMNRPYTIEKFTNKITQLREEIPSISISSDLILGFPDESEANYDETKATIQKLNFSFLHVFPYSKRDGTKSCELPNHLQNDIKKNRCKEISSISKLQHYTYRSSFIGEEVDVLYEYEKDGYLYGHTSEYELVKRKGDKTLCNTFVKEKILSCDDECLYA